MLVSLFGAFVVTDEVVRFAVVLSGLRVVTAVVILAVASAEVELLTGAVVSFGEDVPVVCGLLLTGGEVVSGGGEEVTGAEVELFTVVTSGRVVTDGAEVLSVEKVESVGLVVSCDSLPLVISLSEKFNGTSFIIRVRAEYCSGVYIPIE